MSVIGAYQSRMTDDLCDAFNRHINLELQASYHYLMLATHCNQYSVALPGFEKFFEQESLEERDHAQQLIKYMNLRGKKVKFAPVSAPLLGMSEDNYLNLTLGVALNLSLTMEMQVTDSIHALIDLASEVNDPHAEDWLCDFVDHQLKNNRELQAMITQFNRVGQSGHGLYEMDQDLATGKHVV